MDVICICLPPQVPDLLGINGLNSGAPNFGIPGTQGGNLLT